MPVATRAGGCFVGVGDGEATAAVGGAVGVAAGDGGGLIGVGDSEAKAAVGGAVGVATGDGGRIVGVGDGVGESRGDVGDVVGAVAVTIEGRSVACEVGDVAGDSRSFAA